MNLFIAIAALFSAIGNILMKLSSTQFNTISQIYFIAGGLSYVLNLILFKKGIIYATAIDWLSSTSYFQYCNKYFNGHLFFK